MPRSSASTVVYLPFGSLTGVIPIDSIPHGRVLGDFARVLAGSGQRESEIQQQIHSTIDPFPHVRGAAAPGPSGDGGI